MTDTRLYLTSIYDICRPVSKEEFSANLDDDAIYSRSEPQPPHQPTRIYLDQDNSLYRDRTRYNPSGFKPLFEHYYGPQKTFLAHFREALVLHDGMTVVAACNQVVFPGEKDEVPPTHLIEKYINRSAMSYCIRKTGPGEVVEWEHYLKSPPVTTPYYFIEQPHVLLSCVGQIKYHSFMFDIISRLWIYEEWPELREYPVLVPPMGEQFEQALADAIGIPRSQLAVIPPSATARFGFRHLVLPSALGDRMVTKRQLTLMRERVAPGIGPRPGHPRRRIYLSRCDRPHRTCANEAEVVTMLQTYGFETVVGADLSLQEQAQLFSETEMLVGISGSGFTNMIYMQPGSVALEMTQRDEEPLGNGITAETAVVCDLHHLIVTSEWNIEVLPRGVMAQKPFVPTSMLYDLDRLREAVEAGIALLN